MGRKKTTTLYLDEDLVARCKELNINMSQVCERILKAAVSSPTVSDEEIRLEILLTERQKVLRQLEDVDTEKTTLQERLEHFNQRIVQQKKIVGEVKRSNEVAFLMRTLNRQIKDADFNMTPIPTEIVETLEKLKELGVNVDAPNWLDRQIERVKRLSES